jgi:hypothetical protein
MTKMEIPAANALTVRFAGFMRSNEDVEKLLEGSLLAIFGGLQTPPGHAIAACRPFYEVDFAEGSSANFRIEFFYSFNVLGEGPPERRSRGGDREAQLLGGPSRPGG